MGIMPLSSKGLGKLEEEELRQWEAQRYQQQQINWQNAAMQNTTTTTAGTVGGLYNTLGSGAAWLNMPATQTYSQCPPQIDRLKKLEPGWFYVRWRKREDQEAEAWAVPIIALVVIAGRVEYQLAGANVQAQSEVRPETFLGIVNPKETYDHAFWCEKARAAYYDYHAAEVAAKLLKSAAQGGKAA